MNMHFAVGVTVMMAIILFIVIGILVTAPVSDEEVPVVYAELEETTETEVEMEEILSNFVPITEKAYGYYIYNNKVINNADVDLIALVTIAEAEGEPQAGQRRVIDTIFNRMDDPDTVADVVYQPWQYTSMWDGRADRCLGIVTDDIREMVLEEFGNRTDSEVVFFRTERFSEYGSPLYAIGNHYFSKSSKE